MRPQSPEDLQQHRFRISQRFIIPKSQDAIAPRTQKPAASFVGLGLRRMLAAVNFDREPLVRTAKIYEELPDRMLPTKLRAAQPTVTQKQPELALGIGLSAAQATGTRERHRWCKAGTRSFRSAMNAQAPSP